MGRSVVARRQRIGTRSRRGSGPNAAGLRKPEKEWGLKREILRRAARYFASEMMA